MDISRLCLTCMTDNRNSAGVCRKCGKTDADIAPLPHHLRPRTVLGGCYVVGKVIGEGGFGITYLAWDTRRSIKVAIKEYFPKGYVNRDHTDGVSVYSERGERGAFYKRGLQKFVEESQRLAHFYNQPGIVGATDMLSENNTAYLVMEYIEGATLKTVLDSMGGYIDEAFVLEMMKPLIMSLGVLHRAGILHRDIAPDNIMIQPNGKVKLLDFGAAKEADTAGQSTMAVLKHGYSPEEQYGDNRLRQGTWTDVYALCATIYRAIEGEVPPDALERLRSDSFKGFSKPVSEGTRIAVNKGLAVSPENRWRSMEQLFAALYPQPQNAGESAGPDITAGIGTAVADAPGNASTNVGVTSADGGANNKQSDSEPQFKLDKPEGTWLERHNLGFRHERITKRSVGVITVLIVIVSVLSIIKFALMGNDFQMAIIPMFAFFFLAIIGWTFGWRAGIVSGIILAFIYLCIASVCTDGYGFYYYFEKYYYTSYAGEWLGRDLVAIGAFLILSGLSDKFAVGYALAAAVRILLGFGAFSGYGEFVSNYDYLVIALPEIALTLIVTSLPPVRKQLVRFRTWANSGSLKKRQLAK